MKCDLTNWPVIDVAHAGRSLRQIPLTAYPGLANYGRAWIYEGLQGQGGLFLGADMAKLLSLQPGMRVLDLACGAGVTSIYLAETFGVTVYAVDEVHPAIAVRRAEEIGISDRLIALEANARNLPFSSEFFDAVFCMNSFFYFGTDDLYLSYLPRFLKPGGEIVVGSPCYRDELSEDTPEEFYLEFPPCLAVHSPDWWRRHFEKTGAVEVLHCSLHPRGAEFWKDRVQYLIEEEHPQNMPPWKRDMTLAMLRMLNRDADGLVSHYMLHASTRPV